MSILNCSLIFLLSYIHLQCHHSFHPLFSSLFLTALLTYIFDSASLAICGCLDLFEYTKTFPDLYNIFDLLERISYFYVSPILLLLLFERTFATILVATYEYSYGWKATFIFTQIITVFSVGLLCYFEMEMNSIVENLWSYFLFCIYLSMYLALFILLVVNRRQIIALQTEKVTLTLRYQLAENVKTIKMLSIFLLFDTMITLIDLGGFIAYGIGAHIDNERIDDVVYILFFTGTTVVNCVLENIFPFILLFTTHAYYRKFLRIFDRKYREKESPFDHAKVKVHQLAPVPTKQSTKLRNVLGAEIVMQQDTNRYFENLKEMWK
ncbi:unnamed protein product, partial [Mesorhabditis belari]|uniref:Gustatory receptor n=1 Tax=Mesorhabditis belari TaxID=2138241 RepID=A0AAF3EWF4_9BILA